MSQRPGAGGGPAEPEKTCSGIWMPILLKTARLLLLWGHIAVPEQDLRTGDLLFVQDTYPWHIPPSHLGSEEASHGHWALLYSHRFPEDLPPHETVTSVGGLGKSSPLLGAGAYKHQIWVFLISMDLAFSEELYILSWEIHFLGNRVGFANGVLGFAILSFIFRFLW